MYTTNNNKQTLVGCADSGCSNHFICEDAPCINKKQTQDLIIVGTPNGSTMTGSHLANLNLDHLHSDLPPQATTATVIPSLKQPLLSLEQFCYAGSNIILTKDRIYLQPHQHTNIQQATNIGT